MSGNKIQNLQLLQNAGFNVPRFNVIPFSEVVDRDKYKSLLAGEKSVSDADALLTIINKCLRDDFDINKYLSFAEGITLFP